MTISTTQVRDLLLPGLNAIFGDYDDYPAQWRDIFSENTSDMYREIDVEMKMLGLGDIRTEGAAVAMEDMGERYQYSYVHQEIGLGFIITQLAIEDNLYKSQFNPNAEMLKFSLRQTQDVYGAAIINNGTDTTNYPGGDGVSLFNTAHPIDVGTVANTGTVQAELNESSLQDAIIGIQRFKNAAGLRVMIKPKKLIVATELQFVAQRLLHTELRVGTANNDTNAIRTMASIPGGFSVNQFFTNTKSWIVTTNQPNGLKHFTRRKVTTGMYPDFLTDNLLTKATYRDSFGWSDFRGAWGMLP